MLVTVPVTSGVDFHRVAVQHRRRRCFAPAPVELVPGPYAGAKHEYEHQQPEQQRLRACADC